MNILVFSVVRLIDCGRSHPNVLFFHKVVDSKDFENNISFASSNAAKYAAGIISEQETLLLKKRQKIITKFGSFDIYFFEQYQKFDLIKIKFFRTLERHFRFKIV